MDLDDLRYPIGPFEAPAVVSTAQTAAWIDEIERFPAALRAVVAPLTPEQLETPYRPAIKPYFEERWAELRDYVNTPIDSSLRFLDALHERWVWLLRSLGPDDLAREFVHPESGVIRLDVNIGIYAWHGRHHLAHITRLVEREGWDT